MHTPTPQVRPDPIKPGQRLLCQSCGAEIQVLLPSPALQPNQVFKCCGTDMVPNNPSTTLIDMAVDLG